MSEFLSFTLGILTCFGAVYWLGTRVQSKKEPRRDPKPDRSDILYSALLTISVGTYSEKACKKIANRAIEKWEAEE